MAAAVDPLLAMLKVDLRISTTAYDERLTQVLASAAEAIAKAGGALDPSSPLDQQLQVMYAAWLWSKRDTMEAMPEMVRWALANNVFANHAGGGVDD